MKIKSKPFFKSFLLSFVIFALVAAIIVASLYNEAISISPADEETTVLVGLTDQGRILALTVINFDPERSTVSFLPIPDKTYIDNDSSEVQSLFENGDPSAMIDRIELAIGTRINRHMLFSVDAVADLTDALGGLDYHVSYKFLYDGMYHSGTCQMDGDLFKAMMRYDGYNKKEVSMSDIGYKYLTGFMSAYASPKSITKLKQALSSDKILGNVNTDLVTKEIEEYCVLLTNYPSLSHKQINLIGESFAMSSSTCFKAEKSDKNIFK